MNHSFLAAMLSALGVAAQSLVTNPTIPVSGCDALSCAASDGDRVRFCSTSGFVQGIGIAPQAVQMPGSSMDLSLSLVNGDPQGSISAPYKYFFTTQKLYVGAPRDLQIRDQQQGCALMFQYQAQTFPFLTATATPNTTQCGDAITDADMERLAQEVRAFTFDDGGNNSTDVELQLPRCAALAQYLNYQIRQQPGFSGYYYENLVTVTGGALVGSDVNTSSDAIMDGPCQPTLPQDYQLYHVLEAQQVLHSEAGYDAGRGGRNGTTPIITVMYGSDNASPTVQMFCMQQLGPQNQQLPKDQLQAVNAAQSGRTFTHPSLGYLALVTALTLSL